MNDKYVQIFTGDFNDFKEITENQESTNILKLSMVILMIKKPWWIQTLANIFKNARVTLMILKKEQGESHIFNFSLVTFMTLKELGKLHKWRTFSNFHWWL